MFTTAIVLSILLVCAALVHCVIVFYFRTMVMLGSQPDLGAHDHGLASVILSVRGCDPGLRMTLIQLLSQDYDNFEIHLIVDHRSDRAWQLVHEVKREFDVNGRLTIHEMTRPLKTCGLKCSALLQGLDNIHPNSKYLVLIDADVVPPATWLRQLIAPLSDRKIGVVTGNQWFEPADNSVGSLLRSLRYAGALVPTAIYSNPWAGTFAMRMRDVRRARLPKIWRKSIVDDGPIRQALKPLGLQIHFAPALIMVNRERCTLKFVCEYVARTLTWSKMYEPTFLNTIVHCVAVVGLLILAMASFVVAVGLGAWQAALVLAAGLIVSSLLNLASYFLVRGTVSISSNLEGRGFTVARRGRFLKLLFLTPVACLIYGYSCFRAARNQQICWRQITYELRGKSEVKMLRYHPWISDEQASPTAPEVSI
jgi:cellulose synthase/poly-beta-1,6-N-acetylglucosamine synthase-like glycosyltransferase